MLSLVVLEVVRAPPLVQLARDGIDLGRVHAFLNTLNIIEDILLFNLLFEITLALAFAALS